MPINESQLDLWVRANPQIAQGLIVELVWKLVAASSPKPRDRHFPLGDSIGQHGPDGFLDVGFPYDPFIPEGRSYWEIGTGWKASKKATSDYRDLTSAVPKDIRAESTFVFVTPLSGRRSWEYSWKETAQAEWLKVRRKKGEWKDVRIVDGTKLIDWAKSFPTVGLWLAHKIGGIPLEQIEIPAQYWSVISSIGEPPPLPPGLFLANRTEACAKLKDIFDGTTMQLKLTTHYPSQVVDFVVAFLASLSDEDRADAEGRCLIVSGVEAWTRTCANPQWKNLILVADASLDLGGHTGTSLIQKARRAGHAIMFGGLQSNIPDPTSVPLPVPTTHQIQVELEKAGYSEERARALAQKSDGNLSSLLRCLQNLSVLPEWAEKAEAAELAIAVLLGSWNDKSDADRGIVESISGKAYGEWIQVMREIAHRPSTPLIQLNSNWKFISRYEGWYALGPRLFDEQLDRLKLAAVSVLHEKDPRFDLPAEQRYAASIYGKIMSHSDALRNGVAETIALLGSHPKALTSCSPGKAIQTAALTVRELLDEADWNQWASLNDLLPLLAEAAPTEFLVAVEKSLYKIPCPFDEVFAQEGDGFSDGNYMAGLLWALETLAWDPEYLTRAVICLGELAVRDPGGKYANRPADSLTTIFLPWLPQTCAPVARRIASVRTLLTEIPDIAWKLLISLLPQISSSTGTRRPVWRTSIPEDWREEVSHKEYWEQIAAYAELAINYVKNDFSKLIELIEHLDRLPPSNLEQLLGFLESDFITALSEVDKTSLWNMLVDLITKHRKFPDAKWAMKSTQLDRIAELANRVAPKSAFFLHQRLFSAHPLEEKGDYEKQWKELEKRRQLAVEEITTSGGTEAVIEFAKAVQSSWLVGIAFGGIAGTDVDAIVLPSLLESEPKCLVQFAGGFIRGRFNRLGWKRVDCGDYSSWTSSQIGQFLSFLPFMLETWERARLLLGNDQSAYWSRTTANPYEADTNLEVAVDRLIEYGRPHAAIRCLNVMLYKNQPFSNQRAVRGLTEALKSSEIPTSVDVDDILDIIKALQKDPETNPDDLFKLEWAYLPLLVKYHGAAPVLLTQKLAHDSSFFCWVIRLAFPIKEEEPPTQEAHEKEERIASNAYLLLREWRTPPGLGESGAFDGQTLTAWVDKVKQEFSETKQLVIAMTMIGHVLIYAPADPEGLWIHHSAAKVLDTRDADDIREGFRTELFNSRGVHWVDSTGKQERDLADKYRAQAEAIEIVGYHRLANTIRELAVTYERESERISSRSQYES